LFGITIDEAAYLIGAQFLAPLIRLTCAKQLFSAFGTTCISRITLFYRKIGKREKSYFQVELFGRFIETLENR